jgi:probable F420-dependent oxidoreductase
MRFAYGVPLSCPLNSDIVRGLPGLAHRAESAGFHAGFVTDHPIPSRRWRESGGHDALDPFVALAAMCHSTSTLRLLTNLAVVPYRNPFLLAKATATLDVLSNGRLILGAGVGYLKSEFAALGVDFDTRNVRFDEYLELLKLAWKGGDIDFEGQFVRAKGVSAQPPTVQQPRPPIWLGGNSRLTRRRVAEQADGWMPMPVAKSQGPVPLETVEDLLPMLDYLRSHADSIGRVEPIDVMCVLPIDNRSNGWRAIADQTERLAEAGVTWVAVNGVGESMDEANDFIENFGNSVIDRFRTDSHE